MAEISFWNDVDRIASTVKSLEISIFVLACIGTMVSGAFLILSHRKGTLEGIVADKATQERLAKDAAYEARIKDGKDEIELIKVAAAPRKLLPDRIEAFKREAKNFPKLNLAIDSTVGDTEGNHFANAIRNVFVEAGYQVSLVSSTMSKFGAGDIPHGIELQVPNQKENQSIVDFLNILTPMNAGVQTGFTDNVVYIVVWPK